METHELIEESLLTLTLNKARTFLAMLGVIIGIGSVIALVSLGQSTQSSITNQIQSLGSNLLTISPSSQAFGGVRGGESIQSLTLADAEALKESTLITTIESVSAEYSSRGQIIAGRNNTNAQVIGVLPEYQTVRSVDLSSGSFINQRHVDGLSKVVVLGTTVATDLFGENSNPVGQTVRIDSQVFTVVGVTASKGGTGFNNPDESVFIPLTTAQKILYGVDYVGSISVSAISENVMQQAEDQITQVLLNRHKIRSANDADFRIFSQEDVIGTITSVTGTFTTLLSGIAAISLVVGGIGIMNIMLVTVTERTREIGLRKALGAKRKIITAQFLTEAVMITLIGGIIGTILGITVSAVITNHMDLPFVISLKSIILAFSVSAGVGILFGWYPAQKAAKLEPIEALRYE
ncbi:ABC transporter permease [Candidatus Woesebacteria bacterium]|nr:ABC transporter permease [Candidatus Woesebacteria bacterium]